MTGIDYARIRKSADAALKRAGQAGFLRRAGAVTGDPWNPAHGADTDYSVVIVPIDASFFERPGSLVKAKTDTVLMSAEGLAVVPDTSDRLVYADGTVHEITDVRPLAPGGTAVLYELDAVR